MKTYLLLLRGINVGGKNTVSMAQLKTYLEEVGYENVRTYINSGNVIVQSDKSAAKLKAEIEALLPQKFSLDTTLIKVLVLTEQQLQEVVDTKPEGFGDHPEKYHSDVIFLIDIEVKEAMELFQPREGVDMVWQGKHVIYSQRLSAELTKSRLGKIVQSKQYKSMTIRTWNTTVKLLTLMKTYAAGN